MAVVAGTNSYISEADANAYFSQRLHSESWTGDNTETALIQACSIMETRVFWKGSKTSTSQALQWPRAGLLDHYKTPFPKDEIPDLVKQVQCELALYLLENDPFLTQAGIQTINFSGLKINTVPKQESIPGKVFQPIAHWGELLDNRNYRLTR